MAAQNRRSGERHQRKLVRERQFARGFGRHQPDVPTPTSDSGYGHYRDSIAGREHAMSAYIPKAYCFATAAQWAKCIMHRLDHSQGVLVPAQRLGSYAVHIAGTEATKGVPP